MLAWPIPMRPWRGTPDRNAVTIGTSSGSSRASRPARIATLAEREPVPATSRDAPTTSASRVTQVGIAKESGEPRGSPLQAHRRVIAVSPQQELHDHLA